MTSARETRRAQKVRRRVLALLLLLLLLLLLRECSHDSAPRIEDRRQSAAPDIRSVAGPPKPQPPRPPMPGRLAKKQRPSFEVAKPEKRVWVRALQLEVSARSPRLARCFEGSERPGAIKWSAAIDLKSGQTSDHDFTQLIGANALRAKQRKCLEAALSDPPYKLPDDAGRSIPERVGMVLEF